MDKVIKASHSEWGGWGKKKGVNECLEQIWRGGGGSSRTPTSGKHSPDNAGTTMDRRGGVGSKLGGVGGGGGGGKVWVGVRLVLVGFLRWFWGWGLSRCRGRSRVMNRKEGILPTNEKRVSETSMLPSSERRGYVEQDGKIIGGEQNRHG